MAIYNVTLDIKKQSIVPQIVYGRVGDHDSCTLKVSLQNGGLPYIPPEGTQVRFECVDECGHIVRDAQGSLSGGMITYTVCDEALALAGTIRTAYFRLYKTADVWTESTESFVLDVKRGIGPLPKSYIGEIEQTIVAMKQQMSDAWATEECREERIETFLQESQDRLDASLEECATRLEAYQKETNDEVISVIAHARDAAADARNAASQAYSEASSARSRTDIAISHSSSATAMANAAAEAANAATEAANAAAESVRNIETIEDSIAVQAIESLFAA